MHLHFLVAPIHEPGGLPWFWRSLLRHKANFLKKRKKERKKKKQWWEPDTVSRSKVRTCREEPAALQPNSGVGRGGGTQNPTWDTSGTAQSRVCMWLFKKSTREEYRVKSINFILIPPQSQPLTTITDFSDIYLQGLLVLTLPQKKYIVKSSILSISGIFHEALRVFLTFF